ncbi:MAG: carboxypeptidase-like regulatory domain-containing protein [Candidatus Latescibacteria bacterium]|nr:carboxypeptidase-like regulatory domain-containing protein [Candidatus Latescibacterota bacterium]
MSRLRFLTGASVVLIAVCFAASAVMAATTGKIVGRVTDEKGEPLPGASVAIEEARLGGTTDADGFYVIVSVTPGQYKLTASMVGFHSVIQEQVGVRVDFTTTVNFQLRETELELEDMVVVAERRTAGTS